MIHKKYRIITLLLICILLSNFIFEYKAHAEAIAISAGFALFLKACYAAGITYIGGQAVTRVTKESMELYKEWQNFIDKQPPEKKPPSGWEKSALGGLLGIQAWDSVKKLIDSVKDFFDELGAKEGDNKNYFDDDIIYVDDLNDLNNITFTLPRHSTNGSKQYMRVFLTKRYNIVVTMTRYLERKDSYGEVSYNLWTSGTIRVNGVPSNLTGSMVRQEFSQRPSGSDTYELRVSSSHFGVYTPSGIDITRFFTSQYDDIEFVEPDIPSVNYYYEHNSYQFTNNPNDIRPVYPNFDNLPDGKLVQITDPHGKTSTYYKGSFDDLFNDWVKSQDPNKLFGSKPVTGTITDDGIKIGDDGSELPYPNPNPNPDPQPTPTPEGLGQIIQLLKDLINWTSKIFRKIPEPKPEPSPEPQPEPESLLEKLFKPDTNIKLETDKLKKDRNLSLKFPFSIPWDLARVVKVFARSPSEPDLKIDINTEYLKINHTIDLKMITLPIGFFRFAATAFFIFFLVSKTRDLIKW